jgi:SAM-dependent methyltransferase
MNRWFYVNWAHRLDKFVSKHDLKPQTVFDVGAGTGFWVDWWLGHGAKSVAGCDLVPLAVDRLRERLGPDFSVVDVSSEPITGTYELVSVMNVLLHVTASDAFAQALTNVASAVAHGGYLLLMEPLVSGPGGSLVAPPDANSLARPAEAYIAPLRAAGLELVGLEASTAIGSDPIERQRRGYGIWRGYWDLQRRGTHKYPRLVPVVGRFMCTMDPVLLRLGAAPSEKFVLLRRP